MSPCCTGLIRRSLWCRLFAAAAGVLFLQGAAPARDPAALLPALPQGIISPTQDFKPTVLIGVDVNPDEPFTLIFYVDPGDEDFDPRSAETAAEIERLVKYFLTSLTLPDDEQWVNLSPYERERIVPDALGLTVMGEDLLAADYTLKTLAASLLHPQTDTGRSFWNRAYEELAQRFGRTDIPLNTFNKLWIVPHQAVVLQKGSTAVITKSELRVLTEGDYVALMETYLMSRDMNLRALSGREVDDINKLSHRLFKDTVLPVIVKEVNEGRHFARLRQIYHSVILATWFKRHLKELILNRIYSDQEKIAGVNADDPWIAQKIYFAYLNSVKQGVYQFITTEEDPVTRRKVLRRHFSGGVDIKPTYASQPTMEPGQLTVIDGQTDEPIPIPSGNVYAVLTVLSPVEGPWTPPHGLGLDRLPVTMADDIAGPDQWVVVAGAGRQTDVVTQLLNKDNKVALIGAGEQDQWPQEWTTARQTDRLVVLDATGPADIKRIVERIGEQPVKAIVLSVYEPVDLTPELAQAWKTAGVDTVVGVPDGVFTNPAEALVLLRQKGISVRLPVVHQVQVETEPARLQAEPPPSGEPGVPHEPGGVNLNPVLLNLELKRDEAGRLLPVEEQPIERFKDIPGFIPVIQTIHPVDLKAVLDAA